MLADQTVKDLAQLLPIIISATLAMVLVVYGWFKRKSSLGILYFLLLLSMAVWMLLYSAGLLAKNSDIIYLLNLLEYFTKLSLPVLWLYFAFDYSDLKGWKSPGMLVMTLVLPSLLLILAIMGQIPDLVLNQHKFLNIENSSALSKDFGVNGPTWHFVHIGYSIIYFLLGTVMFIRKINKNPNVDRKQAIILTLGVLVPWIGNITFILTFLPGGSTIRTLDMAPFTYVLAGGLIAWGLFYNRFMAIVLTARRVLVERMIDGLVILDHQNWILDINPSAQKMFKVNALNIIGQPAPAIFRHFKDVLTNLKYTSRKHQEIEIVIGSEIKYYDLDINPLYESNGNVVGKMMVFHDISSLKEAENKLRDAKSRAEQSDTLKSAFLANMSHEIRTPMNAIIGFSNLLNDAQVSEEERNEFIQHIKNSGNSLLHLIDDIIDISKLDAGQMEITTQTFSVPRLISELFSFYNEILQEAGKSGIQLMLKGIKEETDWYVIGDAEKIQRILRHLLDNAVKFTHQGFIEFGVTLLPAGNLHFSVQDSGIGIAQEKQKMIFERFSRVVATTRQEYGGTGLGLAICKSLVDLLGGKIWVESIPGKGSTFNVSIPVTKADEYQPPVVSLQDFVPIKLEEVVRPVMMAPQPKAEEPKAEEPKAEEPKAEIPIVLDEKPPIVRLEDFVPIKREEPFELPPEMPTEPDLIFTAEDVPKEGFKAEDTWSSNIILVIEPDEMAYLYLEMILRKTKVNLVWTKHLHEAVNYLDGANRADLVIMSSQLSDAKPLDVIKSVRSRVPQVPVVAIIPFEGSSVGRQCMESGCSDTIPKPLKPDRLVATIRLLLP